MREIQKRDCVDYEARGQFVWPGDSGDLRTRSCNDFRSDGVPPAFCLFTQRSDCRPDAAPRRVSPVAGYTFALNILTHSRFAACPRYDALLATEVARRQLDNYGFT
mgnify:CR=1 FL=1